MAFTTVTPASGGYFTSPVVSARDWPLGHGEFDGEYLVNHRNTLRQPWKTMGKWRFNGILWDVPFGTLTYRTGKSPFNGKKTL